MSETTPTTTTGGGGESEQDNSSSANVISSLLAERGTGTADDEIETSSIEALNWSEADEEELQQQQQQQQQQAAVAAAQQAAATTATVTATASTSAILSGGGDVIKKDQTLTVDKEGKVGGEGSGGNLSTSLVESINCSDDPETSKKTVIENWASGVKDAVDRGEIEMDREEEEEDESSTSECSSEDEDGRREEDTEEVVGDEEDEDKTLGLDGNESNKGTIRKRRKLSNEGKRKRRHNVNVVEGYDGSVSGFDDRLSNAPVLDDGPIWNKGAKRYRFHENRRINQKLTFGVLLAVVLAIGLGLGNLVAVNECESEYKSSQVQKGQEQVGDGDLKKAGGGGSKDATFTTADSANFRNEYKSAKELVEPALEEDLIAKPENVQDEVKVNSQLEKDTHGFIASPPPVITPEAPKEDIKDKYTKHMETLSKIVKTLDNLQQKIDNFENKTRQLGGVVTLKGVVPESDDELVETPEEEDEFPSSSLYDEQVHDVDSIWDRDDNMEAHKSDFARVEGDTEEANKNSELLVLELIDGIEETLEYVQSKEAEKSLERLRSSRSRFTPSWMKTDGPKDLLSDQELRDMYAIEAVLRVFKQQTEEFIRLERARLRELKILGLAEERRPEDYSQEEKAEIRKKFDAFVKEYPFKAETDKFIAKKIAEYRKKENDPLADEEGYRFDDFESVMSVETHDDTDESDPDSDFNWMSNYEDSYNLDGATTEDWNFRKFLEYDEIRERRKKTANDPDVSEDEKYLDKLIAKRFRKRFMEFEKEAEALERQNIESESFGIDHLSENFESDPVMDSNEQLESEAQSESKEETNSIPQSEPLDDLPSVDNENPELTADADDMTYNFPKGEGDPNTNRHQGAASNKRHSNRNERKKNKKFVQGSVDSSERSDQSSKRAKSRGRKAGKDEEPGRNGKKNGSQSQENEHEKENFNGKNNSYDRKQKNHKENRNQRSGEKEYKDNKSKQDWKDYDYDDDDDHKRKRYAGNRDSSSTNNGNQISFGDKKVHPKEQDTAWLQERAHSRDSQSTNSREKNSIGGKEDRRSSQMQTRKERSGMKQRNKNGKKARNQDNI